MPEPAGRRAACVAPVESASSIGHVPARWGGTLLVFFGWGEGCLDEDWGRGGR